MAKSRVITLNWTKGVDLEWHWDNDGTVIVDRTNLSPEATAEALYHCAPSWIGEAIKEENNG